MNARLAHRDGGSETEALNRRLNLGWMVGWYTKNGVFDGEWMVGFDGNLTVCELDNYHF
jgi:hypothetical protein